jgi:probable O-glycosylation ligase (exosortase A-associated)
MTIRDLLVLTIVLWGALVAIRRPWIGVMLWTWLSLMNPHRYTWGWAYDAPVAAVAAATTLLGLLMTRERDSPFKGAAVTAFALLSVWITISWANGLNPSGEFEQWDKVMKINLMVFVGLALLRTKQHIFALAWVTALSLGLLGTKGGVFTVLGGGSERVWGPPGSFIADNNEFALATIMTIPLLRFVQMQVSQRWLRHLLTVMMLLCAVSALGSQSRGALLAIVAMASLLWWRGKSRFLGGIVIVVAALGMLAFMPEQWAQRMSTIDDYQTDMSSMGRISAWWTAWGVALHYPTGAGFNVARTDLFSQYSPYYFEMGSIHAAHSIYFQMLGSHGFVGLFLFLLVWIFTWWSAGRLRSVERTIPEAKWCSELGAMCQVSLAGYLVGGAFLSLSYFDLPYNIMMLVVLTRVWVQRRAWESEPVYPAGWRTIPGLATAPRPA